MKLVNFFKMAVLAAAAFVAFGCEQLNTSTGTGDGEGDATQTEDLTFTLKVKETLANSATVSVSHNGTSTDTWYGFVTTDTESNEDLLISEEINLLLAESDGTISGLMTKKGTNVVLKDLEESTDYRYIVTGLTAEGEPYGESAYIDFSTKSSTPDGFTVTDTWTISYTGRTTDEYGDEVEVFNVDTDCDTLYYVTSYPAYFTLPEEEGGFGYDHTAVVSDIISTVQYYASAGLDLCGSGSLDWQESRLVSDAYVVYAVGFHDDGDPTYTYSYAEIEIEEEVAEEDYLRWIGTWKMTSSVSSMPLGQNGEMEEIPSSTYVVTIDHYDNNYMYAVTGWEMQGAEFDFSEYYEPEELPFPAYYAEGQLEFQEYDMFPTVDSETATSYTHYFGIYGYGDIIENGQRYSDVVLGFSGYGIPMALTSVDGENITLNGCTYEEEGFAIEYRAMGYLEMPLTDNGVVSFYNYPMFFPITMEKVSDAGTASAAPMSVSQSKTFKFKKDLKDFKALKGLSLNEKKPMEPRQYKLVKKTSLR